MKIELENKFSELNRRVKLTSKARYCASRRLSLQSLLSQWTLALLSVALIIISLISAVKMNTAFSEEYIDVMQIIFAVLVLTYSLLLGTGDYSARSVRIHRCGMELGKLARKIKPLEKNDHEDEKYENHNHVDYLEADYSSIDWYSNNTHEGLNRAYQNLFFLINEFFKKTKMWLSIQGRKLMPIAHYLISISLVYYWLFSMVNHSS